MYNPELDGIDHINIYSKGKTELGRFLSNFTYSPIITEDGKFNSIEGYWYWLGSGDERLRSLSGFNAKKLGKTLIRSRVEGFEQKIYEACWIKLHSNTTILTIFITSILPFTHYYVFGTTVRTAGHEWLIEMWEKFRKACIAIL